MQRCLRSFRSHSAARCSGAPSPCYPPPSPRYMASSSGRTLLPHLLHNHPILSPVRDLIVPPSFPCAGAQRPSPDASSAAPLFHAQPPLHGRPPDLMERMMMTSIYSREDAHDALARSQIDSESSPYLRTRGRRILHRSNIFVLLGVVGLICLAVFFIE